jgi:hypothetical protein
VPQRSGWSEAAFRDFLRTHSQAEKAIETLVPGGQHKRLISLLQGVTEPGSKVRWHSFTEDWVPSSKRAKHVAKMLEDASAELAKFARNPLAASMLRAENSELTFSKLAAAMQLQAHRISSWADSPSVRLCRLFSFRKVWKHLPLALAVEFVKQYRTGPFPWGDFAYALEAIVTGYGVERGISPDALRKQYTAFIRSGAGKAFALSGLRDFLLSFPLS